MSSYLRSLTSGRYLHSASQVFDSKHSLPFNGHKSVFLLLLSSPSSPDGLHLTREEKSEQFHFLVFTDVFGNKTHGVVMQYYRPVLVQRRINTRFTSSCCLQLKTGNCANKSPPVLTGSIVPPPERS